MAILERVVKCFPIQQISMVKVMMRRLLRFRKKHSILLSFVIFGLFLTCALVFSQWQTAIGDPIMKLTDPSMGKDADTVRGLRAALNNSRLSETDRSSLQKKLELNERLAAQRATKPAVRTPKGNAQPFATAAISAHFWLRLYSRLRMK